MKVNGTAELHAPREQVWRALNDPAVLVRTIPGCQQLEEVGPDRYRMTVTAGVASIKGTYTGEVAMTEHSEPDSFVLQAAGAGAPGTVKAEVLVRLAEADGGTQLRYEADAVVGGTIGGVGQRMLAGVARKTAGEFFGAVDKELTGQAPARPAAAEGAPEGAAAEAAPETAPADGAGRVYTRPPGPAGGGSDLLRGAVVGATSALAGVLVGWLVSRRR